MNAPRPHAVKQVLVMRNDTGMNVGKTTAQGAHGSLGAFLPRETTKLTPQPDGTVKLEAIISADAAAWFQELSVKIVVSVPSEQALIDVFQCAKAAGLPCVLIRDAGLTHFAEPTLTAVGIGPADASLIDPITRGLPLLR
jgi:PTH2 family peptidyl-tRNA hydrolase